MTKSTTDPARVRFAPSAMETGATLIQHQQPRQADNWPLDLQCSDVWLLKTTVGW